MRTTLRYFRPYLLSVAGVVVLLFSQAMCDLSLPGYMADIINYGILAQDMHEILRTGLIMLGITLISVTCAVTAGLLAARVSAGASRDMRRALFRNVTDFSAAEMDQFSTASLITRSTNDVQMIQQTAVLVLRTAIFAPIMGVGALIKALNTSPGLTWTVGLALLAIILLMIVAFVAVMPKFRVLQNKLDRLNQVVGERLSGLLVVRAFNAQRQEEERFDEVNTDLTSLYVSINRWMSVLMPAMNLVMSLVNILIVWFGAKMIDAQSLMIGDMLAFMQYAMHVIMSFLFVTMIFIMLPRAAVSANRIGRVLETRPTINDAPDAREPEKHSGIVSFDHVSFAYPGAEEKTLDDITFTAEPGRTTAIIGSTGSGKSTLVQLLPRLFDVTEGSVSVDGMDVREMPQRTLRERIGYVPQKGLLFSGTVADNLRYGRRDASPEEMKEAAETAQAWEFIEKMPEGLDTEVAQGGTSVSGGQKQRLSIARALIKKPEIYIFDDSFSALDFKTDAALRRALKERVGDATIIIVAQRINTILDADQILVMDEGKIVGRGTHRELMKSCTVYREIARSQLSEEELTREGADHE